MHRIFIEESIRLALQGMNEGRGGPFGAVVVRNGEIIGRGFNQVTSTNDPTAHAEIVAIREACRKLKVFHLEGCSLYSSCEPCPMCLGAIYWAKISELYFAGSREDAEAAGFSDHFIYREFSLPLAQRQIRSEQLLRNEAVETFEIWKRKADKKSY